MTTLAAARTRFAKYSDMPGPSVRRMSKCTVRATALGQKHDCLPGRVARADDRHVGVVVDVGFDRGAGVIDARAREAVGARGFQPPPANAQGQENHAAADLGAAIELEQVQAVRRTCRSQPFDLDGGDDPRAELEHLQNAAGGEFRAAQSGRKADEVLDARRAPGLPAGSEPVEHQGRKTFGRRIHGRRNAGRSGADNREIDVLRRAVSPDTGFAGQRPAGKD